MLLMSAIVSGLGLGSMYGLIALGFYLTYAVSGTVNFAQGSSMMLGAVLTFAFARTLGWPYPLAVGLALVLCALYGLLVEFVAVRPFVRRGSEAWLMATVALGIVLDNVVLFTYGKEPRSLPSSLAHALGHRYAGRGAEPGRGTPHGHSDQAGRRRGLCALDPARRHRRGADRAALQRQRRHGHAVRPEGVRG